MEKIKKIATVLLILQISLIFTPYKEIRGRLTLVGTARFPNLVIITNENERYYFDEGLKKDFMKYLGRNVTVKAKIKNNKLTLADNSKTFIRPTIYKAKFISTNN